VSCYIKVDVGYSSRLFIELKYWTICRLFKSIVYWTQILNHL